MIEVEKRAFVSKDKYEELVSKFSNKLKTTKQISCYYDSVKDFRVMLMKDVTKMWLKEGKMHDDFREEHEVYIDNKNRNQLLSLLKSLGYNIKIKWYRVRNETKYKKVSLTIDYTIGYGYIVEGEVLVNDDKLIDGATDMIHRVFYELGIELSDKNDFKEAYANYENNWRSYTSDLNDEEFLK